MILRKSSIMLANFISKTGLQKDINIFLKNTESKAIRKEK